MSCPTHILCPTCVVFARPPSRPFLLSPLSQQKVCLTFPFLGYQGRVARLDAYSATVKLFLLQEYSRPEANSATVSNFWLQEYSGPGGYRSQGTGFLLQEYSRPGANLATVSDFLLQEYSGTRG